MRALKVLVAVMSVLIIAGVVTIGVTIFHRIADRRHIAPPQAQGHASIAIPAGAEIIGMSPVGEHLVLRLRDGGGEHLLVIDPPSGALIETIDLVPNSTEAKP